MRTDLIPAVGVTARGDATAATKLPVSTAPPVALSGPRGVGVIAIAWIASFAVIQARIGMESQKHDS